MTGNARWTAAGVVILAIAAAAVFLSPSNVRDSAVRSLDKRLAGVGVDEPPVETPAPTRAISPEESAEPRALPRIPRTRVKLSGRIVSDEGGPLEGAEITAYGLGGGFYDNGKSRTDGMFDLSLSGLARGMTVYLRVDMSTYAPVPDAPVNGEIEVTGDMSQVEVVVGSALSLTGTVVDRAGNLRPGTSLLARRLDGIDGTWPSSESKVDGSIKIDRMSPGDYEFAFIGDGEYETLTPEPQRISMSKGEQLEGVRIICPDVIPAKVVITGRVTDSRGAPVANAQILTRRQNEIRAETDADGRYTAMFTSYPVEIFAQHRYFSDSPDVTVETGMVEGLPAVPTQLRIETNEDAIITREVRAAVVNVNFVLPPMAAVEGRVVDARTSRPVQKFRVRASAGSGDTADYTSVQDADGRFNLKNVKAGAASVWVIGARGFADTSLSLGTMIPGETRRNVEVRLTVGCEIEGHVVDSSGRPVRLARLSAAAAGSAAFSSLRMSDTSNDDGYFYLASVPTGAVQITAEHEKFAPATVSVNVAPGVTSDVRIVLGPGAGLRGSVNWGGQPVDSGYASASFGRDHAQYSQIADDGTFEIRGVPDGPVRIGIIGIYSNGQTISAHRVIQVRYGKSPELTFDFAPATAQVEGRVMIAPNTPAAVDSVIQAYPVETDGQGVTMQGRIDQDGRFRLAVPPGEVRLAVSDGSNGSRFVRVQARENETVQRDINLYGGAALYLDIHLPKDSYPRIWLLDSAVDAPKNFSDLIPMLSALTAATARASIEGQATIRALEPGTYTLLAALPDTEDEVGEFYRVWDSKVIKIGTEDEVVTLDLSQ